MAKARRATAGNVNKSQAIRTMAEQLGTHARPRDIRSALKEQGIEVTAALVTNVMTRLQHQRPAGRARAAGSSGEICFTDLVEAKAFADRMGSIDRAKRALDMLAKLR